MRALLIDDEPLARKELRRLLSQHAAIEIVGEAGNIDEAQKLVQALKPQLLFLDVQMPGGTGFDLLERLISVPYVIFTTAYDHHAVKAFEVSALDYLLKPIEPERLAAALARLDRVEPLPNDQESQQFMERLFVRDGPRCWFIPLAEVRLISSEGNYVRLFWNQSRPLYGCSLVTLEQRLDPQKFFRANRQQLINLDFVEGVDLGLSGRLHVQLRGGSEIEVSRRQARVFREKMSV